jgi:hypothetical protein
MNPILFSPAVLFFGALIIVAVTSGTVLAHCDSMNGPVVQAAEDALANGDFDKVAIWVTEKQSDELREVYKQAQKVRELSPQAKELADRHFYETAVRLHRQAEGMPYTGLKPAGPMPPDVQAAERALDEADVSIVQDTLTSALRENVNHWYEQAMEARAKRDQSVEAGREWADAYVRYIIYVHSLYQKIEAGPAHGVGEED